MKVKKWGVAALCAGLAAFGLAACGEDGGGSEAPEIATLEGDPIVIGTVCSCTGPQSAVLKDSTQGISAWVNKVNSNGGLNGHPVELIIKDDAGDPAKGLQMAKELVDEGVVAIVGMTSTTDASWQTFIEEAKVPVVGGIASEATFITSADFFPSGANAIMQTFGAMQEAKAAGLEKVGVLYCSETPVCAQVDGIGKAFAAQLGIGYESGKIAAAAPDYNAACLNFKGKDVDGLFVAHNASVVTRVLAGCVQNGYDPKGLALLNGLDKDLVEDPNFDGTLLASALAMYTDESVEGVAEYRDAMEEYNPGFVESAGFNAMAQFSWSGGKLFETAAVAAELGPDSQPADVYEGLYALQGETLGGMAPPLTFAEGSPAFPACYYPGTIADATLESTGDPVCLDEEQMGQIGQLLSALG